MITENEKARIKEVHDFFMENAIQIYGETLSEEQASIFIGTNMATLDALFAIREGESWRGHTDPREIARAVLRQGKIGE